MKEEKRHVGRPTNEEVKERNTKKIIKVAIAIIIIICVLILCFKSKIIKIQGIAKNNELKEIQYYQAYEAKAKKTFTAGGVIGKGFKISISKEGLAKGYKSTIITTDDNYFLNVKYVKPGKKEIEFSKNGYKTVKKTFWIIPSKLILKCPKKAYVNEEFTCKTNVHNAVISVSKEGLANGYNTSFTTTLDDMTKQTKYTTPGVRTIKVVRKTADGKSLAYNIKTKKVKIIRK